jgi:hypothetical protein
VDNARCGGVEGASVVVKVAWWLTLKCVVDGSEEVV